MKPENDYDVIVVGAGPAGSFAARKLAEQGLNVVVFDRNQEIGSPKRCGEGFSRNGEKRLGIKFPEYVIAQHMDGAWVYAPNGKKVVIEGQEGYILERKQSDKWLAGEAANAGAKIFAKAKVFDVMKEDGFVKGVKVNFLGEDFEVRAKVVVVADGVESTVARKAGLNTACVPTLVDSGIQYEMYNIDLQDPHKIELYFGNDVAPRGYVWIFPKGECRANVGVGIRGDDVKTARYYLDKFIETRPDLKKGSIIEVNAGSIPVGGFLKNMVMNGLVVVGDAAHQVNPIHGGGMYEAMTAGRLAAEVIKKAFDKNDFSASVLEEYNKIWWKERGESLRKVEKIREAVEKLNDEQLNNLAELLQGENLVEIVHGNYLKLARIFLKFGLKNVASFLK